MTKKEQRKTAYTAEARGELIADANPEARKPIEADQVKTPDEIKAMIKDKATESRNTIFKALTDEQMQEALVIFDIISEKMASAHDPELKPDGTIELDLMTGGRIVIKQATGFHVMNAKREMIVTEKMPVADQAQLLPYYVMAACSTIDGEKVSIEELQDKLSARDFRVLDDYFRRLNLI